MPAASKEQIQGLYDALANEDLETAGTLAESINPGLRAQLQKNPNSVMRVAAGLLGDPDRPFRPINAAPAAAAAPAGPQGPGMREQAAEYGQALPGQPEANLPPAGEMLANAVPLLELGAALASGGIGVKAAQKLGGPLLRKLATAPQARLLVQRGLEGLGGSLGAAVPQAIQQGSTDPLTDPVTLGAAALPAAATIGRRLMPGAGGAMRVAGNQAAQLRAFDEVLNAPGGSRAVRLASSGRMINPTEAGVPTPAGFTKGGIRQIAGPREQEVLARIAARRAEIGMGQRLGALSSAQVLPEAIAPPMAPPVGPSAGAMPAVPPGPGGPPPMAPPQGLPPGMAPPVGPPPGASFEDIMRASVAQRAKPPPMAPPGTQWTPKVPMGPPAPPPTPDTLTPEGVQDVVGDVLGYLDNLPGMDQLTQAAGMGGVGAQAAAAGRSALPGTVGQGGGDAGLLARFAAPAGRKAPRKIGRSRTR